MTAANHAKASMILVVMLDPSMTVRPVKLTLSLTGLTVMLGSSKTIKIMLALARLSVLLIKNHAKQPAVWQWLFRVSKRLPQMPKPVLQQSKKLFQ